MQTAVQGWPRQRGTRARRRRGVAGGEATGRRAGQTTGMAEMRRTRSLGLGPSRRRAREGAVRRPTGHVRLLGGGVARPRRRAGAGSHAEATRRRPRAREEVGRARGRAPTELLALDGRKQRRGRGGARAQEAERGDGFGRCGWRESSGAVKSSTAGPAAAAAGGRGRRRCGRRGRATEVEARGGEGSAAGSRARALLPSLPVRMGARVRERERSRGGTRGDR